MHGTYGKILYDRIYIFGTNRTLKEAVDQLGIKGDRNNKNSLPDPPFHRNVVHWNCRK